MRVNKLENCAFCGQNHEREAIEGLDEEERDAFLARQVFSAERLNSLGSSARQP